MGIYYGDEFAGVLLRYETEIIYEIKFDVITDKIKEEIHKVLEDVEKEEFANRKTKKKLGFFSLFGNLFTWIYSFIYTVPENVKIPYKIFLFYFLLS